MITKDELLKKITDKYNDKKNRILFVAEKMYDRLESLRSDEVYLGRNDLIYIINGYRSVSTYINYEEGVAEFLPVDVTVDIGSGFDGGMLRIDFNELY